MALTMLTTLRWSLSQRDGSPGKRFFSQYLIRDLLKKKRVKKDKRRAADRPEIKGRVNHGSWLMN
jgi:hypothetical protein